MKTDIFEIRNNVDEQSRVISERLIKFDEIVNIFDHMLDISPSKEPRVDVTAKLDTNAKISHIYINMTDGENTEQFSIPVSDVCSFITKANSGLMFCSFTKIALFDNNSLTISGKSSEILKYFRDGVSAAILCYVYCAINTDTTDAIAVFRLGNNTGRLDGVDITPIGYNLCI